MIEETKEVLKISTTNVKDFGNYIKFNCLKCDKRVTESKGLNSFKTNGKDVFTEFIELCKKCGKKELKKQTLKRVLSEAIQKKLINSQNIIDWKQKKISQKEFWDLVNHTEGDLKKKNEEILKKLHKVGVSPSDIRRMIKRKSLK